MYQRIVVALDGSEFAEHALDQATFLATKLDLPIHIVRAVDTSALAGFASPLGVGLDVASIETLSIEEEDIASTYVKEKTAELEKNGFAATGVVLRGPAATTIVAGCQEGDLLVMASHGRSGVERWFLGSVAEDVIRRSSVPVLLVRVPKSEETES